MPGLDGRRSRRRGRPAILTTEPPPSLLARGQGVRPGHEARGPREAAGREELIRLLLDSTVGAVCGIDLPGNCIFANQACARLLRYADPGQLEGRNLHALVHHTRADGTRYPEAECPIGRSILRGEAVHGDDDLFWCADGTRLDVEFWSAPMCRNGEIVGAVVTFLDNGERKHLAAQLRQAQKLEAMGLLTGGVAHDFNNLLTVITGHTELLMRSIALDDPMRRWLEEINRAGQRSVSLTRQLLAFGRKQPFAPGNIDLNQVVRGAAGMIRLAIGEDVQLSTHLDPGLGSVRADRGQVEQVLLNLAVNARDAMPQGGTLSILTRNVGTPAGAQVLLEVKDSGVGMNDAVRRRLFEPFFTDKEPGKGTGLGLAIVHAIVKQSDGQIEVDSEPAHGARFRIYLPRVDQPAETAPARQAADLQARGTETILLAEDDEAVRTLVRHVLAGSGYAVLEAREAGEALRAAAQHAGPIHLLVTDVVMPGTSGRVLADRLLGLHPESRVLYLSGHSVETLERHGISHEQGNFLAKPFSPGALLQKIRSTLSR
jgi:two-component system cell cycle sensor histidine kinase/response regulator CckA